MSFIAVWYGRTYGKTMCFCQNHSEDPYLLIKNVCNNKAEYYKANRNNNPAFTYVQKNQTITDSHAPISIKIVFVPDDLYLLHTL